MNLLLLLACTSGPSNSKDQSTTAQTQTKTQVYNPDAFSKPKTSKYGFEDDAHWCNFLAKDYDSDVINVDSWNAYIDELGQSLVAKLRTNAFTYRFRLVSHSEINAFALCHGWVFVDVAMVRFVKNEAELASVLAHEIMHNHKGHLIRDRESFDDIGKERGSAKVVLQNLRRINKRREFEEDADEDGVKLLMRAGFDGKEMVRLWRRMSQQDSSRAPYANHESFPERISKIEKDIRKMKILIPKPTRASESASFTSFQADVQKEYPR